jgi:hypothetical protein
MPPLGHTHADAEKKQLFHEETIRRMADGMVAAICLNILQIKALQ